MSDYNIWRTSVFPGDSTYLWTRGGHLPINKGGVPFGGKTFTLDDSIELTQFSWGRTFRFDDPTFATGLAVPANAPVGTYHLHINGADTGIAISVEAQAEPKPVVTIPPSGATDSAAINAALNDGKSVQLLSGVYTIDSNVVLPTGAAVRGAHRDATFLKRLPAVECQSRLFTSAGDHFALSDFTAEGIFANWPLFFHNTPGENKGVVIQRLRLRNMGSIAAQMPGALVEDVEFENSGGIIGGTQQMWKDIRFRGIGLNANESIAIGDQFALINATWENTGRGLILRSGPGNSYFNSLSFSGIDHNIGGDEIILVEEPNGPGLQNCIFSHINIRNCSGAVTFWLTPVGNNLFRDMKIEGGMGIVFAPGKAAQSDNMFDGVELRGCAGIKLGGATGNSFKGLAIISPRPTWGNQGGYNPTYYARSAAITGSDGNIFNPVTIMDLPEGWKAMD